MQRVPGQEPSCRLTTPGHLPSPLAAASLPALLLLLFSHRLSGRLPSLLQLSE